jgi:hypothetical protein
MSLCPRIGILGDIIKKIQEPVYFLPPLPGIVAGGNTNMTKLFGAWALTAMSFIVAPQTVLAYDIPIQASFAVAFSGTPNTGNVAYCGGTPGPVAIEAHGDGFSTLGALAFSLQKTQAGPLFHGCLILVAPNGDTLTATYDAAGSAPPNANHFAPATGTLMFTGGTGRFRGASGSATFTAVFDSFYPASSFAGGTGTAPLQGMAFYVVQGKMSIDGSGDDRLTR